MEYMVMVVLIVGAIIAIILFLTWWNITQLEMQGSKNRDDRILALGETLSGDYLLVNDQYMFDDAKLSSLGAIQACDKLQSQLGTGWYARIKSLDMGGEVPCTWNNYPECNVWTICSYKEKQPAQIFPVNVYRKSSDRVALAILEVGVYS